MEEYQCISVCMHAESEGESAALFVSCSWPLIVSYKDISMLSAADSCELAWRCCHGEKEEV